jgi:putative membrane protein
LPGWGLGRRYGAGMSVVAQVFVVVAGVFHLGVFVMESLLFRRPSTYRRFLVKDDAEAAVARPWAFNQGFYNLFLALGALGGLIRGGDNGEAIALFACACMAGAGIVLIASDRRMVQAAAAQAVPPIAALVLAAVL